MLKNYVSLATLLALIGCGGGGGSGGSVGTAPVISNLVYAPDGALVNDNDGTVAVDGSFDFVDPDGNIASYTLTLYDASNNIIQTLSDPIPGANGITNGYLMATLLVSTVQTGVYQFEIFLTDAQNLQSNILTGHFTVIPPIAVVSELPDTGVDKCYDNSVILCPIHESDPLFGQDRHYSSNPMSFTNHGDGTITDNVSMLMWQMTPDGTAYNWYEASGTYHVTDNPTTMDVCGDLTIAGYTDWRLPLKRELQSIIDYGAVNPALDTTYFPDTSTFDYWSNSQSLGSYANYLQAGSGWIGNEIKTSAKHVQCVRGTTWGTNNFVDQGDGTVSDSATGLMWQKTPQNVGNSWTEMLATCTQLALAGYSDWRLPDIKELATLTNPAADAVLDANDTGTYATTTTTLGHPGSTWLVIFDQSYVGYGDIFYISTIDSKTSPGYRYRCVR